MISNRVIEHEKESGISILEENGYIGRKIPSSTDILSRLDIREMLSVM